jgi:hypothetical protein
MYSLYIIDMGICITGVVKNILKLITFGDTVIPCPAFSTSPLHFMQELAEQWRSCWEQPSNGLTEAGMSGSSQDIPARNLNTIIQGSGHAIRSVAGQSNSCSRKLFRLL